eukprot:jgi/Hompol1/5443/HPOL_001937-RA
MLSETHDRYISSDSATNISYAYEMQKIEQITSSRTKRKQTEVETELSQQEDASSSQILTAMQTELTSPRRTSYSKLVAPLSHNKLLNFASGTPQKARRMSDGLNLSDSPIPTISGLSHNSIQLLKTPKNPVRYILRAPYKVLDAPAITDDFYLNLVDWSSRNTLSVALGSCVYLLNAATSRVTKMCELQENETVTSVNWVQRGTHLAVGTSRGFVQLWDVEKSRKIRQMSGHTARVGSLAWNAEILSSGSKDRTILQRDVRTSQDFVASLQGHKQEVCGLKWSPNEVTLASGGNDNKLLLWDNRAITPFAVFSQHCAAVKAIAWNPRD